MIWLLLTLAALPAYPLWICWVYFSYIRARRAYFLSLTPEQLAAARAKRNK